MRPIAMMLLCCLAGVLYAGEDATTVRRLPATDAAAVATVADAAAWIAEYRLRDARGQRDVLMIRDHARVEYRPDGEPVRQWRQLDDGLELREVLTQSGRVIVFTPGDLRALQREPEWDTLQQWVSPNERAGLKSAGRGSYRLDGGEQLPTQRYRDERNGARVQLEWLAEARLPVRYRHGDGDQRIELQLVRLRRADATGAFTPTAMLEEIDYADIGDREHDPTLQRYVHMGERETGEHGH